ncbi:MAG: iron-only hydrogenase system regulator [Clostridiales bacterium]|uniref:TM1266 family iron-only hydrogenase system putative regulator n=1 Tax=Anaerocaecibacter muris TaxID=2941513 RepID=UPI00203C8337|nr:TM1266 family iron-only hydrogenase system putative regulator [Anaerocaecibacter muris]MDE6965752.1 iron-only hydrogenase system regulator [Clostridiales bacterium]
MQNEENRIAVLGIIVSDGEAVEAVNALLHEYGEYVVGRMGLPMRDRGINAITLVLDAPANAINALSGKLGRVDGVSAKALFGK